jgi:hypothetical protein
MKAYPTRNGISIPVEELRLPESQLDMLEPGYYNNHHNEWSYRRMAASTITLALRNLERHQFVLATDVHDQLHKTYGPPEVPTFDQATREIIDAFEKEELFKFYDATDESYYFEPIPLGLIDKLVRECGPATIYSFR